MFDLMIENGLIVDGTGNPGIFGTVGVKDNTVSILKGDTSSMQAGTRVDAAGKVVCPGFIDVHAHSALMILVDPHHMPKVHQGITTELFGIDGNSYAPFADPEDLRRMIQINSGLEGTPDLPKLWSTVPEYMAMYDGNVSVNVAYVVGNSPLRVGAMGWNDRRPTAAEMDRQKGLLRDSMDAGAVGMSTGLDYPPGSYADTDELVELSKQAAALGGFYHTHVRYSLGDRFLDPYREAIEIGRRSGIPIHLTHMMPRSTYPGSSMRLVDLVEEARDDGMDVTFDCFPHPHGGTRLVYFLPQWTHDGGVSRIFEVIKSEEGRERLRREVDIGARESWDHVWVTYFKHERNQKYEGRSVAEVAEMMGKGVIDAICDLLIDEDLQTSFHASGQDPAVLADFYANPLIMVGTDALLLGDHPPAAAYGAFPVIIAKYCRDDRKMSLPEAIRKMTSYPAQRLGLKRRGILRQGMKADIVVFDYGAIEAPATRDNPKRFSTGIDYVIVNGKIVVDHGRHTGALPGRALKRGAA